MGENSIPLVCDSPTSNIGTSSGTGKGPNRDENDLLGGTGLHNRSKPEGIQCVPINNRNRDPESCMKGDFVMDDLENRNMFRPMSTAMPVTKETVTEMSNSDGYLMKLGFNTFPLKRTYFPRTRHTFASPGDQKDRQSLLSPKMDETSHVDLMLGLARKNLGFQPVAPQNVKGDFFARNQKTRQLSPGGVFSTSGATSLLTKSNIQMQNDNQFKNKSRSTNLPYTPFFSRINGSFVGVKNVNSKNAEFDDVEAVAHIGEKKDIRDNDASSSTSRQWSSLLAELQGWLVDDCCSASAYLQCTGIDIDEKDFWRWVTQQKLEEMGGQAIRRLLISMRDSVKRLRSHTRSSTCLTTNSFLQCRDTLCVRINSDEESQAINLRYRGCLSTEEVSEYLQDKLNVLALISGESPFQGMKEGIRGAKSIGRCAFCRSSRNSNKIDTEWKYREFRSVSTEMSQSITIDPIRVAKQQSVATSPDEYCTNFFGGRHVLDDSKDLAYPRESHTKENTRNKDKKIGSVDKRDYCWNPGRSSSWGSGDSALSSSSENYPERETGHEGLNEFHSKIETQDSEPKIGNISHISNKHIEIETVMDDVLGSRGGFPEISKRSLVPRVHKQEDISPMDCSKSSTREHGTELRAPLVLDESNPELTPLLSPIKNDPSMNNVPEIQKDGVMEKTFSPDSIATPCCPRSGMSDIWWAGDSPRSEYNPGDETDRESSILASFIDGNSHIEGNSVIIEASGSTHDSPHWYEGGNIFTPQATGLQNDANLEVNLSGHDSSYESYSNDRQDLNSYVDDVSEKGIDIQEEEEHETVGNFLGNVFGWFSGEGPMFNSDGTRELTTQQNTRLDVSDISDISFLAPGDKCYPVNGLSTTDQRERSKPSRRRSISTHSVSSIGSSSSSKNAKARVRQRNERISSNNPRRDMIGRGNSHRNAADSTPSVQRDIEGIKKRETNNNILTESALRKLDSRCEGNVQFTTYTQECLVGMFKERMISEKSGTSTFNCK